MPGSVEEHKVQLTLDASDVVSGAKQAQKAIDGIAQSSDQAGERSEDGLSQLLGPLAQISKQLSQLGRSMVELTGVSRQNGVALLDLGNKLTRIGTQAVKTGQETRSVGKALKDTEAEMLDFGAASVRSNERVAQLDQELKNLEQHKKALEQNGLGLGFADYDRTLARMQQIKASLKEYRASLLRPVTVQVNAGEASNLNTQLRQAKANLASLERSGFGLGNANYDRQYLEVQRLTQAVKDYRANLAQATAEPMRLSQTLSQAAQRALTLGRNLASAVGSRLLAGIRSAGSALSGVLGSAVRRVTSIGTAARSSNQGLTGMVRSIRNIGVVALGLKGLGLLFGELRSVVTHYLSTNQAAAAAVTNLKNAFANALAPAINIAINALNAIVPYVQAVSNAFATLFTNLFGAEWTTISAGASSAAASIGAAGDAAGSAAAEQEKYNRSLAGFDQITKLDDNSSSGGGGSSGGGTGSGTTTDTIGGGSGMLGQFSDFMTQLSDLIKNGAWADLGAYLAESWGKAVDSLYDILTSPETYAKIDSGIAALSTTVNSFFSRMTLIEDSTGTSIAQRTGETLGAAINLAFHTVNQTVTSINWGNIGLTIAQTINGAVKETNFSQIGETVANVLLALPSIAYSAIINTDWGAVGTGISDMIKSALGTIGDALAEVDWAALGHSVADFLLGIDWVGIALQIIDVFASALSGLGEAVVTAVGDIGTSVMESVGNFVGNVSDSFSALADFIGKIDWIGIITGDLSSLEDGWDALQIELRTIWEEGSSPEEKRKEFEDDWEKNKPSVLIDNTLQNQPNILSAEFRYRFGAPSVYFDNKLKNKPSTLWSAYLKEAGTPNFQINNIFKNRASTLWSAFKKSIGSPIVQINNIFKNRASTLWSAFKKSIGSPIVQINNTLKNTANGLLAPFKRQWGTPNIYVNINPKTSASSMAKSYVSSINAYLKKNPARVYVKLPSVKYSFSSSGVGTPKFGNTMYRLARGGIVNRATMFGGFQAGEDGAEAIIPLENHTEWLDKVADRLISRTQTDRTSGASQPICINVYVGEDKLVSKVVQGVNDITLRTGTCPIYL